ncbi:hypothetical protein R1C93_15375 [Citrobacter koseri]|uniref:hypothetical protein n=1 Tax=Citrobacter koseri TaxID=545 RepID=UPI002E34AD44|nr:hypothetical protein [Citrobacter koseri]
MDVLLASLDAGSNSNPAHGPLSDYRLHRIREILGKAAAQSDGGNIGYAMSDAVRAFDELLEVRKAEPVGYYRKGSDGFYFASPTEQRPGTIPLYAAPPAPVVPENCVTAEHRRVIEMLLNVCGAAFELADDSCQQDVDGEECHVVPDDAFQKLSDALDEIENTLPTEDVDRPDVFLAWSAMPRAALKSILQAGNSPVTPDGYVLVPKKLTAENGAKSVLSGEFSETKFINCPECFGDDECETCDGSGRIEITVPVTWTTIKAIWAKGVEHFAAAPQQE